MSMMMMAPHALLAAPLTTIPSSSSSFSSSSSISSVSSLQNALFPLSFSPLRLQKRCSAPSPTRMGLKIVHTYDSSFELKPECRDQLHSLLNSSTFCAQVGEQFAQKTEDSTGYEFTGELFQPVPWSATTPHGMPQEFEKYFGNPDYAIVNVPPNFMFRAKIFSPSRLCAIFRKVEKTDQSAV